MAIARANAQCQRLFSRRLGNGCLWRRWGHAETPLEHRTNTLTNCSHVREPLGQVRPRRHSPFMFARVSSLSTARAVAQRPMALRM